MDNKKFSEMLRKAATESQPSPAGSSGGTGGTSRFRQMLEAATTERKPFPTVANPISASGKDTEKKRNKPNQLTERDRQQQKSRGLAMEKLLRDTANNPDAKLNVGADYYISRFENSQKARGTSIEKTDAYGKIGSTVDARPSGNGMDDIRGYYYGEDREEERAKIRDWLTGKGYDGIVNQMRQYDDLYRGRDTAARNYRNAEDFERVSAARNAEQYTGDAILDYVNALNSGSEHGEPPVNDLLALSKRYDAGTLPELHGGAWGTDDPYAYILSNGTRADLHHLSADEEQMYYYILNKQGAGAAREYLNSIASLTNMRAQQAQAEKVSQMNGWEAALYSAASVPARALGSIWSTADKIEQLGQGKIGYSRNQGLTNLADVIRSETAGQLDEATGGANLFGFGAGDVYQALMSGADSAFGAGAFGQAYTALMGLGAASAEAEKLTRAGASEGQIIAGALTAGAAETVFEYASIEHLIKMRDPQAIAQAVKNALVQGGIEASEEVFTELSNMITNGIIMGSQSDFEQGIQALMAQGKSRAAATAEYIASSLYEAGMGGFISGGAAGGSTVAGAVLDNVGQTRQIGNAIRSTEGGVDALKALAQQVAEKKGNRQERGIVRQVERAEKKATDRTVGKLSNKIDHYRATQNRGDIAKVLQEKGGLSGIRAISAAQTVSDVLDGNADELTQERFEKLMQNERVAAAVNELWSPTSSVAVRNRSHTLTRMGESAEGIAEINNAIEAITKDTGEEADVQKTMEKAQEGYETSSDGETFLKETGLKADGVKIVGRENGKLMVEVQTEEGKQIVPASEISYASEEQAKIFGTLDLGGIDAESAQAIAQGYTSGTNVDNYLMGTDLAYRNGKYNLREGMEQVAELIGTEAAENAWQRGRIAALEAARAQNTTTGKKTGGVSYEGDRSDYSNLSDVQNASVKVLDKLGKALGINYHLYKSYVKDGKRVYEHNGKVVTAPNGYFVTESGEIYIDINAGDNGEGVILWTAAHEMVHDMRRNNAEGFDRLAGFLFSAIEKDGVSVHDLALEHMVRDKNLTEEAAMEEVVADAMQEMLTREDAAEQVRKLKTEDKGLWRKLRDVFRDLAKKLHALYQQFAPQSHEAQIVRQMEQAVQDRLAELFYEGVATAAENRNAETEAQKTDDVLGQDATGYSETIEDEAKFSTRYDEEYMNAADQYNKTHGAVDQRLMDKARKDRAKIQKEMETLLKDDKIGLPPDIEGDTFFADSSYGGSEENTTVCPRSLAAEAFVDEVSKFVGRPLTVAEQLIICQDLQNRMKNPECLYCYVATDRKAYREFLGEYLKQRDRVLDAYRNGETDTSRTGNLYNNYMLNTVGKNGKKKKRQDTAQMWDRFNIWINAEKNGGRMISSADLASIHDLQELSMDKNGELYEQLSDAMKYAQAASWAKKRVGYVAYNNHILKWKQSRIDILNSMYGLRFYSFSDFSPAFILENMQMVTDAAARALKSLAYTKDLDFVRIFAKTNMNINVSVFGFESEDGGCVPNEIIGANWAEAQKLREQYENVGCTFVATSDRLVEWALEQDWIDVVIPYHLVRTGEEVRKALGYTNYTKESSDKKIKGKWNKDTNEAHISPVQHDNDLGKYLAALKQNNLKPRFERWIKNPNYMKLVNETRLSVSESKPLVPVFDMDAAMESLAKLKANGYYTPVGGNYETMQNLALAMADTIHLDANYMDAVKTGDMETAQRMVDEAARAAGYTSNGDRQTPFGIFTKSHDRSVGQVKSADPVTYDDNGNVIPISERFNPEKKDIRYSQRGGAVTTRDMLTLMDAETVKNADEKRRLTEYQEKAAAYDEQQYIIATLTEDLREIRRGKGKRNMDIVRDLQAEIRKAENRANIYAGQMARLENGTFIQRILNRNLREQNGVAAAKEVELNRTAEQLRRENQRLQTELYSSKVEALAESALREQEFNDQLRAAKEDYQERSKKKAAEVNERIQKLREEFRARRAKELQERREKYENSLREMREDFKERSKQRTSEFNERLQRVREGYQESRKRDVEKRGNTVIRHKIAKLENDLRKQLLKPSEGHYVPKELVGSTIDLLNAINMDSGRSERVAEKIAMIRSKYDAMKSDEKYAMYHDQVFSDALQKLVESIGDTSVAKMDRKQLEDVYDIMKAMHKTIRDAVKITIGKEEYNAYQLSKQAINETMAVKTKDSLAAHWVGKQLRAETAFERFGGFAKDSAWSKLAKLLNDGQLKQTQITMEASQIFAELVNDKQAKTLLDTGDKATVDIGLKDENGEAVKITRGMMLSIYMHLQNTQNARHLAFGGLTLPGIKAYYKGDMGKAWGTDHGFIPGITGTTGASSIAEMQKLKKQIKEEKDKDKKKQLKKQYENASEALVFAADEYTNRLNAAIEKQLTEYDRRWIAAAKEFFDGYSRRVLNEATEEMYHFSKANVQNYFPIRTDPNYRQASFDSITRDMSLENSGFMKERVEGARNPILLEDITDVVNGQVRRVAAYAGLAPAIRSFGKVYGKTMKNYENSLQNALASKFGKEGKDYVENLLADLTGSRRSEGTIFDALRGNMAGATLSLNPRVALAQAASFPTAAAELGVAPLAKALAKGGKNGWMFSAADRELISKYSPLLWYRMQGYRDTEIGDVKASQQFMAQANKKLRWALGWIQAMDGATVGRLWFAAQYYVDDHFGELEKGSDAYYQKVAEVFNRVVEKTQPNYTVMQRPDILRNPNALVKQLTMFMTQRLQNFNIVYEGLGRWKKYSADYKYGRNDVTRADLAEARNTALRSVGSQVAAAVTIAAFKLLADALTHSLGAYRDDDEELTGSSIVLELVNIFTDSIISSTLWGSEFAGAVKYAIAKAKGESASFDMISIAGIENLESTLQSIIDSATGMNKLFDPDKRGGQLTAIEKTAFALSQAFGLPTKNLKKLLRGAWDTASEALNGEAWQSRGVKRTRAQNKNLLYKFMAAGQTEEAEKIAATFDTDKKLHDAIREALREHDDRIKEGGKAWADGDIDTYLRLADEIEAEGAFERDDIISAMKTIKGQFEDGGGEKTDASKPAPGTAEDVVDAITSGQKGAADKLMNEIIKYKVDAGKTEEEAKKSLTQSISTAIKDRTEIGALTAEQAAELLVSYCGVDQAAAMTKARYWRFDAASVYDWSQNEFEDYDEIKNKGISEAKFDQFLSATRGITSEGGATKKEQILAAINKMPLTVAQKDALYYLKGYAESKIAETPWH